MKLDYATRQKQWKAVYESENRRNGQVEGYTSLGNYNNERCGWYQPMNLKWTQQNVSTYDREGAGELIWKGVGLACQPQQVLHNLSLSGKESCVPCPASCLQGCSGRRFHYCLSLDFLSPSAVQLRSHGYHTVTVLLSALFSLKCKGSILKVGLPVYKRLVKIESKSDIKLSD